jgi:hypothetical protein
MLRIRWAALLLVAALLAGKGGGDRSALNSDWKSLQGTWTIQSVQRDGEPDPLQVGAHMTFAGDEVTFQQQVVQIADGTS